MFYNRMILRSPQAAKCYSILKSNKNHCHNYHLHPKNERSKYKVLFCINKAIEPLYCQLLCNGMLGLAVGKQEQHIYRILSQLLRIVPHFLLGAFYTYHTIYQSKI